MGRCARSAQRPRLAAIYEDSFNYLSKMCLLRMREAALEMIDHARRARVPVVVSGSDATDHPDLTCAAARRRSSSARAKSRSRILPIEC